jgi:hypothetical protein
VGDQGDSVYAEVYFVSSCISAPYDESSYSQVARVPNVPNSYTFREGCDSKCSKCSKQTALAINVCAQVGTNSSMLLTGQACTGGLDTVAASTDTAWSIIYTDGCTPGFANDLINAGNDAGCQPFYAGTYALFTPVDAQTFNASVLCKDNTCSDCAVNVDNVEYQTCNEYEKVRERDILCSYYIDVHYYSSPGR